MKVTYNDAPIAEIDEDKPGVILNYAEDGSIVGMEILIPSILRCTDGTYLAYPVRTALVHTIFGLFAGKRVGVV